MKTIHLINPMWSCTGGSEWRTYELYRLLAPRARVRVWSPVTPDPGWAPRLEVRRLSPWRRCLPMGGTLVFVGMYFDYRPCLSWWKPERVIALYNTPHPKDWHARRRTLEAWGGPRPEVAYAAAWMREELGEPGPVLPSPIDLARFRPRDADQPGFTVGRLSRDVPEKHHPGDLALYTDLLARGFRVRIMGGQALREYGPLPPGLEVLPEGSMPPEDFLAGLDALFYRTSPGWREPSGRVVLEAMACGLPVVCGREGGHAESIRDGLDGLLFGDEAQALALLERLREDGTWRGDLGREARQAVERQHTPEALERLITYFLE